MIKITSFSILLSILTITHLELLASARCHLSDEAALLAFRSGITSDPFGMLASWKPGTDCCSWSGVMCFPDPGTRVYGLWLSGQSDKPNSYLAGTISHSLSKLQFLDGLYLRDLRNISGRFPDLLFKLPNLRYVYVENNNLSGRLPRTLGRVSNLRALSLEGNRFTGPVPNSISYMTGLAQLKLSKNFFTGRIPDIFSSFPNLSAIDLSKNRFSGKIPPSIASLAPSLRYLELDHNFLTGRIPDFLGKFKLLDTLNLSSNKFYGPVPRSFANLTKIFNLDLSRNLLTDPFPQMYVKGIESLDLSYNRLNLGRIPEWVTKSPIIYSLKLAKYGVNMNIDNWKPEETLFYDFHRSVR